MDLTPSAAIFRGSYGYYNDYVSGAVPTFKVFSQIKVTNGSESLAVLDLVQRRIPFEQNDGKALDWQALRKALLPDNGPGVVSVKDLENRKQSPVFLRDEIVRRLKVSPNAEGKQGEKPLRVFVIIGSPMGTYDFPALPAIETIREEDCIIYYLQVELFEQEQNSNSSRPDTEALTITEVLTTEVWPFRAPSHLRKCGQCGEDVETVEDAYFPGVDADNLRTMRWRVMEDIGSFSGND